MSFYFSMTQVVLEDKTLM